MRARQQEGGTPNRKPGSLKVIKVVKQTKSAGQTTKASEMRRGVAIKIVPGDKKTHVKR